MIHKVIHIRTETELKAKFQELAHVLHNLRFFTKYWHMHGGGRARDNKIFWEKRADVLLNELGLVLHNNIRSVKVIRE